MSHWEVNHPEDLKRIISIYEKIQVEFDEEQERKKTSIADLIVLGGCAAVEEAARNAGFNVKVPFTPGRVDVSQEQVEVEFYKAIEPFTDGFRNYFKHPEKIREDDVYTTPEYFLS